MPDKMMTFLIQNSAVCKGSRYCREIEKKNLGLNIRILVQRNNFNRNITIMKKRFALIKIHRKKKPFLRGGGLKKNQVLV